MNCEVTAGKMTLSLCSLQSARLWRFVLIIVLVKKLIEN